MSGKSAYMENAFLKLLFNGTTDALWAAAAGSMTTLYVSLHTSDPTDTPATEQTQGETAYTGYARQAVTRSSAAGGWTVTGSSVSPFMASGGVDFPICTAAPGSPIQYVGIGTLVSGNGKLLFSGALSPAIAVAIGVIPRITNASTITES